MIERVMSVVFLLFSCSYVLLASELSFGTLGTPKSGFVPTIAGVSATILAVSIVFSQLGKNEITEADKVNWRKIVFIIIGVLIYVVFLDVMGYLVATCIIMFYLLKVTDTLGWRSPAFISAGVAIVFYVVFTQLLGINLP